MPYLDIMVIATLSAFIHLLSDTGYRIELWIEPGPFTTLHL